MLPDLTPDAITALFTRADGSYLFARWGRPIAPVVFGVTDASLPAIKGGIAAVAELAKLPLADTDPELGANLMVFFVRDWGELTDTPNLDRLVPDLGPLVDRLAAADANQYRIFRFDADGGIKACFVFLCMDDQLASLDAGTLAMQQMVQSVLLWSDRAFTNRAALVQGPDGTVLLRPDIAALIRAAYDPVLPPAARDPSHALRLYARTGAIQKFN
ncbi:hypothetical protein ACVDG3_10535 [Meridianimarinicoccus sp. RP-17]|uniref:hypothetical protein n=1 Tax=Meridianimarinicoccus zhengii TaxID=2056810 RepID=UPI000DAE7A63|nr:hypothetical protein [Phycocomes zhengii]